MRAEQGATMAANMGQAERSFQPAGLRFVGESSTPQLDEVEEVPAEVDAALDKNDALGRLFDLAFSDVLPPDAPTLPE